MKPNTVTRAWRQVTGCCIESTLARQALAEMVGTLVLTLVGDCVLASLAVFQLGSVGLAAAPLGWGLAVFLGVLVAGGVSGAHLNPAVTVALATIGKLGWCNVLAYVTAQYLGAFLASGLVYLVYADALSQVDVNLTIVYGTNATAPVFSCFPAPGVSTLTSLSSSASRSPPACTPSLFSFRSYNWFWVPVVGPHLGAVIGVWIYKLAVDNHWKDEDEVDEDEKRPLLSNAKICA
ncbi:hypothetical protein MRX96_034914 [Rhipicephalus microplus]